MNNLQESRLTRCLTLFLTFMKISPTTFGGGYAILPAIDKEVTEQRQWMDSREMSELTAISGAAPGGIGVNVAAIVGYRVAGLPGLLSSVLGISLPTILIMLILCIGASGYSDNPYVQAFLKGIKPTVIALILYAAIRMGKQALDHWLNWSIMLTCTLLLIFTSIQPLFALGLGALTGIVAEVCHISLVRHKQ